MTCVHAITEPAQPLPRRVANHGAVYGIMYGMNRTTVYLPDELKAALKRAAAVTGRSEAALIREGVEHVAASVQRPRPRLPLFDSGDPTLAERAEELLDGFGDT